MDTSSSASNQGQVVLVADINPGNSNLTGTDEADIIKGFGGRDPIQGGAGDDTLIGNSRNGIFDRRGWKRQPHRWQ